MLTSDHPLKARACHALFKRLRTGEEEAETDLLVVAEVIYVLTSPALYRLGRELVGARLRPLLAARGLKIPDKQLLVEAVDLYVSQPGIDFTDAWLATRMANAGIREIYSYDTDFDRLSHVTRVEPKIEGRQEEVA